MTREKTTLFNDRSLQAYVAAAAVVALSTALVLSVMPVGSGWSMMAASQCDSGINACNVTMATAGAVQAATWGTAIGGPAGTAAGALIGF